MSALPTARLYAYGALAAPLAMLSLPVYVHVPKFYAEQFGLALGTQGALLLAARAFDALQDPLIGQLGDRAGEHPRVPAAGGSVLAGLEPDVEFESGRQVAACAGVLLTGIAHRLRFQSPLRPPLLATRQTSSMTMPRSIALHMS